MLKICWSTAWFAGFEWAELDRSGETNIKTNFWQNMCKHVTGLCKCSLSAQAVNPLNHSFYSCLRIPNIQGLVKRQVNFVWVTNQSWTSHQIGACCRRTTGKNGCNASCFWLYGFHLNRAFSQHQNTGIIQQSLDCPTFSAQVGWYRAEHNLKPTQRSKHVFVKTYILRVSHLMGIHDLSRHTGLSDTSWYLCNQVVDAEQV